MLLINVLSDRGHIFIIEITFGTLPMWFVIHCLIFNRPGVLNVFVPPTIFIFKHLVYVLVLRVATLSPPL